MWRLFDRPRGRARYCTRKVRGGVRGRGSGVRGSRPPRTRKMRSSDTGMRFSRRVRDEKEADGTDPGCGVAPGIRSGIRSGTPTASPHQADPDLGTTHLGHPQILRTTLDLESIQDTHSHVIKAGMTRPRTGLRRSEAVSRSDRKPHTTGSGSPGPVQTSKYPRPIHQPGQRADGCPRNRSPVHQPGQRSDGCPRNRSAKPGVQQTRSAGRAPPVRTRLPVRALACDRVQFATNRAV